MVEDHAGGVVNGNHHLVLSLTRLSSSQPKLVLPEVAGYVLNHTAHARSLAGTKPTSVTSISISCIHCVLKNWNTKLLLHTDRAFNIIMPLPLG